MREILFRGKLIANGEWAYGCLKINPDKRTAIITPDDTLFGKYGIVDPNTVGQYTGLTDKTGVKIFEGDIVEHHVKGLVLETKGVVEWDNKCARWAIRLNTMMPDFYMHNPDAVEVIGNIHDNPELMEG